MRVIMNDVSVALLSVVLGALGQVILKKGAVKSGDLSLTLFSIHKEIINLMKIPEIIIGLILFGISFLLWIKVLSKNELSLSYPLVSLNYIIILFISVLIFDEPLTFKKILGTLLIVIGVGVVYG